MQCTSGVVLALQLQYTVITRILGVLAIVVGVGTLAPGLIKLCTKWASTLPVITVGSINLTECAVTAEEVARRVQRTGANEPALCQCSHIIIIMMLLTKFLGDPGNMYELCGTPATHTIASTAITTVRMT